MSNDNNSQYPPPEEFHIGDKVRYEVNDTVEYRDSYYDYGGHTGKVEAFTKTDIVWVSYWDRPLRIPISKLKKHIENAEG